METLARTLVESQILFPISFCFVETKTHFWSICILLYELKSFLEIGACAASYD